MLALERMNACSMWICGLRAFTLLRSGIPYDVARTVTASLFMMKIESSPYRQHLYIYI